MASEKKSDCKEARPGNHVSGREDGRSLFPNQYSPRTRRGSDKPTGPIANSVTQVRYQIGRATVAHLPIL